jgi:predicted component of type VI protein secretion system
MSRITDYELSHLILRFEQEKDMKPMHCVQNLGALRDLVSARLELAVLKAEKAELLALARRVIEYFPKGDDEIETFLDCDREVRRMARDVIKKAEGNPQ